MKKDTKKIILYGAIGILIIISLINFPFILFLLPLLIFFYFRKRKRSELKNLCQDYYNGKNFVAIDLETSGLNPRKDEIIELAAIKFNKGGERESFISLIKPRSYVPFEIQEMTGIPISKVMEEGKNIEEIREEFLNFLEDKLVLGWNISFDLDFLKYNGIKLSNPTIDVMKLAYDLLPKRVYKKRGRRRQTRRRFYLSSIAKDFGIFIRATHRAGSDAFLIAKVFEKLMEQLKYKYHI